MMRVFVCVSVCVTEIEITCRDIVEHLGSVGTESSSGTFVWQCSTLIQPPGGTVQSEHSSTPELYERKSSDANDFLE